MELRHLRYFVAVAEERNFNRAALRLHISQPPLSRQVRQLEEELGVDLFERASRPLVLTEAGRFFYAHAVQFLAQAQALRTMTRSIGQPEHSLTVGFVASTLYGILPLTIRRFRAQNPQVVINLQEMTTIEQCEALKEGRIDVGFGRLCYDDAHLRRITLRHEPLMAALSQHHPLADIGKLTLHDLHTETLLIYPQAPRPSFADQVLETFRNRALQPRRIVEVRELQVALGLVAAGEGVALVPECLRCLQCEEVVYRPLSESHLYSPVVMSTRLLERSDNIQRLLTLVYQLYEERHIHYVRPTKE